MSRRKPTKRKVYTRCRANRTLADFKTYRKFNQDVLEVEIDSGIDRIGRKVLLTNEFQLLCSLMLLFLRDASTP